MLVVLTETYCNKVNIQITQRDDFIQFVKHCFAVWKDKQWAEFRNQVIFNVI